MMARIIGYMPEDKNYEAIGRYVDAREAFGAAKMEVYNILSDISRVIGKASVYGPRHDPTRAYVPDIHAIRALVAKLDKASEHLMAIMAEVNAYAEDAEREKVEVVVAK